MNAFREGYFLCIIQTNNIFNNQKQQSHFSDISKMGNKEISDPVKEIAGKNILRTFWRQNNFRRHSSLLLVICQKSQNHILWYPVPITSGGRESQGSSSPTSGLHRTPPTISPCAWDISRISLPPISSAAPTQLQNLALAPVKLHAVSETQSSDLSRSLCWASMTSRESTALLKLVSSGNSIIILKR